MVEIRIHTWYKTTWEFWKEHYGEYLFVTEVSWMGEVVCEFTKMPKQVAFKEGSKFHGYLVEITPLEEILMGG
jgi:hypothetical protein